MEDLLLILAFYVLLPFLLDGAARLLHGLFAAAAWLEMKVRRIGVKPAAPAPKPRQPVLYLPPIGASK